MSGPGRVFQHSGQLSIVLIKVHGRIFYFPRAGVRGSNSLTYGTKALLFYFFIPKRWDEHPRILSQHGLLTYVSEGNNAGILAHTLAGLTRASHSHVTRLVYY